MQFHDMTVYGTVKVGERGQIVIPSEARKKLGIRPGDLLLAVGTPMKNGVALIKADAIKAMVNKITRGLSELDEEERPRTRRKR